MVRLLHFKILHVPLLVWVLQLIYVAAALGIYVLLTHRDKPADHVYFLISYLIGMVVIDIMWRVALKKALPGWF